MAYCFVFLELFIRHFTHKYSCWRTFSKQILFQEPQDILTLLLPSCLKIETKTIPNFMFSECWETNSAWTDPVWLVTDPGCMSRHLTESVRVNILRLTLQVSLLLLKYRLDGLRLLVRAFFIYILLWVYCNWFDYRSIQIHITGTVTNWYHLKVLSGQ